MRIPSYHGQNVTNARAEVSKEFSTAWRPHKMGRAADTRGTQYKIGRLSQEQGRLNSKGRILGARCLCEYENVVAIADMVVCR